MSEFFGWLLIWAGGMLLAFAAFGVLVFLALVLSDWVEDRPALGFLVAVVGGAVLLGLGWWLKP